MTTPGKRWRHIVINTHCSWLPADERGFRNRRHRIHSSGDYQNPPPRYEHEGLRDYNIQKSGERVIIPERLRPVIGKAIVRNLTDHEHRLLIRSVAGLHGHFLVELPDDVAKIKSIVGWAKQKSSAAVTSELPGRIWSAGETYKPVDTYPHLMKAFEYILKRQGEGAWTWRCEEAELMRI